MKKINYNRNVQSEAMSKNPYQSGLVISYDMRGSYPSMAQDVIVIQAINPTTKTITSHLRMEIPIENIDDVIGALNELKVEINKSE